MTGLPEDPEHRRISEVAERINALARDDNVDGAIALWESLTVREQRMVAIGYAQLINAYRVELHGPGREYGPTE